MTNSELLKRQQELLSMIEDLAVEKVKDKRNSINNSKRFGRSE